jgi:hypothetical protein
MAQRKAWQIFLPIVAPLLVMQFYMVDAIPMPAADGQPPDMTAFAQVFRREMAVGILMFAFFISWLVSIGWVSNSRIDAAVRPRMHLLLAAAAYAVAYFAFAGYYFFPAMIESARNLPAFAPIIFPMHFLAMAAIFFVMGFAAKNLVMAERQSPARFSDYAGPFFLMWFYLIGIWFVQPRVNRLVAAT